MSIQLETSIVDEKCTFSGRVIKAGEEYFSVSFFLEEEGLVGFIQERLGEHQNDPIILSKESYEELKIIYNELSTPPDWMEHYKSEKDFWEHENEDGPFAIPS